MHPSNMTFKELMRQEPDSDLCKALFKCVENKETENDRLLRVITDLEIEMENMIHVDDMGNHKEEIKEAISFIDKNEPEKALEVLKRI